MARVAIRNLWERKLRTILTSLAIVLGVMMVAGTYILTDTIDRSFDEIFTESNEGIDAVVSSREAIETDDGQVPPFSADVLRDVRRTDGVEEAAGGISDVQVSIIGADGEPLGGNGAPSIGVSTGPERFDPLTYVEGGPPARDDEVVIDKASADAEGFEVGDEVVIAGKESAGKYTLAGIATLGDVDSFGGATMALLTLPEAQRITGKEGLFDTVLVAADPTTSPEELAANLTQTLPRSVKAETGEENTQSQKDDIDEFLNILETALLVFAGVALFVAAFLIFNTFSITVAQRTREFAMLRALGANRRQIITSVAVEALAIGLVASAIGVVAGIGFAPVIKGLFDALEIDLPATGTVIAGRTVILGLCLGTGLTLLAALIPALRATRVPPVAGLREGAVVTTPRQHRIRNAIALVVAILGVTAMALGVFGALSPGEVWVGVGAAAAFIGVALLSPRLVAPIASVVGRPIEWMRGVPGRIARENAVRNPGRTAATAAALMIGLALVAFVAVFAAGLRGSIDDAIDDIIKSDLLLANVDGFSDIPAGAGPAIEDIDGVAAVSPLRYTQDEILDEEGGRPDGGFVTLIDPETVNDAIELDWEEGSPDTLSGLGPADAAVDEGFADKKEIGVGDTFQVRTASGETIEFTVAGTFTDQVDFIGDYAASDVNAEAFGEKNSVTNHFITLEEGADAEAVRTEIDERLDAAYPTIEAQNQQELKDSVAEELNTLLGVVYALLFLAVIVSLFGIVNTLALSIHERTRELGLLRAVGTSRRQVRRIVRYEAVITTLIGAVLGAILGVIFAIVVSRPLADEGFVLSIPVGTLIMLFVLAIVAGVLAAIGPARRASRLDVLEALAYE
jgi:putative ABC transport system permease protein